jgi:hypothetical protein
MTGESTSHDCNIRAVTHVIVEAVNGGKPQDVWKLAV